VTKGQGNNIKTDLVLGIVFILTNFLCFNLFKMVDTKHIDLSGVEFISIKDIIENTSLQLPRRLIHIQTKLIERELKQNISLKQVSVTRQILPFRLKIDMQAREPVAYAEKIELDNRTKGFIDADGVFIDRKYFDLKKKAIFPIKVLGWQEEYKHFISSIINNYRNIDDLEVININPGGFLILEEKNLPKIYLGYETQDIKIKLNLISDIKNQLKKQKIQKNFKSLDLTDPNNPRLKVFIP